MRVAHVVSEMSALITNCTSGHDSTSLYLTRLYCYVQTDNNGILTETTLICKWKIKKVFPFCGKLAILYSYMNFGGMNMKGRMDNALGTISIDKDVIATYAGSVAVECFGIVGMAAVSMKDGLVRLLKRESLKHGINVTVSEDNRISLDFHVIVSYGVSISAVAENLISNVKYQVEEFTGMEIDKINIAVEGVRVID